MLQDQTRYTLCECVWIHPLHCKRTSIHCTKLLCVLSRIKTLKRRIETLNLADKAAALNWLDISATIENVGVSRNIYHGTLKKPTINSTYFQ